MDRYIENYKEKIRLTATERRFKNKEEAKSNLEPSKFHELRTTLGIIRMCLEEGRTIDGNYTVNDGADFKSEPAHTRANFVSRQFVAVDVDGGCGLDCVIDTLEAMDLKPSIYYETFTEGHFRLIYFYTDEMDIDTYTAEADRIYGVMESIGVACDMTVKRETQKVFGTDKRVVCTDRAYIAGVTDQKTDTELPKWQKKAKGNINSSWFVYEGYDGKILLRTPVDWNEGETVRKVADIENYCEISLPFRYNKEYGKWYVYKYRDGEHRREKFCKILYKLRVINKGITEEGLYAGALYIVNTMIDNSDGVFTEDYIRDRVRYTMSVTLNELPYRGKRKYILNGGCIGDIMRLRHSEMVEIIKDAYNGNMTVEENLSLMRNDGVEMSESTLKRILKESGVKHTKITDNDNIINMIDISKSARQNHKLLMDRGIKISLGSVVSMLKDLRETDQKSVKKK